jgi:hypothetical protein
MAMSHRTLPGAGVAVIDGRALHAIWIVKQFCPGTSLEQE